jgi:hypothetical protein
MSTILKSVKTAVAASLLVLSGVASASPVAYGFTVSGPWFDCCGNPFGMPNSPSLAGSITVDNSIAGIAGMLDFELTTGSHTWTESEFIGSSSASLQYNGSGTLTGFSLDGFAGGGGTMYIYSNNTMGVFDASGAMNACNNCVALGRGVPVPEPTSLALVGLAGLVGWGATRRRALAVKA